MLKHRDMYAGVLQRLDKYGTASVDPSDYSYHMNEVIRRVVGDLARKAEKSDEAAQRLQSLERRYVAGKEQGELLLANGSCPLPEDWLSVRNCLVTFAAKQGIPNPAYGPEFTTSAQRVTPDREASFSRPGANYYTKPKVRNPYFRIGGNRLTVLAGNTGGYDIARLEGSYYIRPQRVALKAGEDEDGLDPDSDLVSEFSDEMDQELINECALDFMVRFGDTRTEAQAALRESIQ
jgi:hypothetical protein